MPFRAYWAKRGRLVHRRSSVFFASPGRLATAGAATPLRRLELFPKVAVVLLL